jgi:hypothetical protein
MVADASGPHASAGRRNAPANAGKGESATMIRAHDGRADAGSGCEVDGSPSWTRTSDHSINSRMLYQLSYRGSRRSDGGRITSLRRFAKPVCVVTRLSFFARTLATCAAHCYPLASRARASRPRGGVATQRTANPCTPVRFRARPPQYPRSDNITHQIRSSRRALPPQSAALSASVMSSSSIQATPGPLAT